MFDFLKNDSQQYKAIDKIYEIEIFSSYHQHKELDVIQFERELLGDLNIVLSCIFDGRFEIYLGKKKDEIFYIDKEAGILKFPDFQLEDEYKKILLNMIFSRISLILYRVKIKRSQYFDCWKNEGWNLTHEFSDEWYFDFFNRKVKSTKGV